MPTSCVPLPRRLGYRSRHGQGMSSLPPLLARGWSSGESNPERTGCKGRPGNHPTAPKRQMGGGAKRLDTSKCRRPLGRLTRPYALLMARSPTLATVLCVRSSIVSSTIGTWTAPTGCNPVGAFLLLEDRVENLLSFPFSTVVEPVALRAPRPSRTDEVGGGVAVDPVRLYEAACRALKALRDALDGETK